MKRSLVVWMLLAGWTPARAEVPTPRPTPRLYVTGNYGVRIEVPAGLYYCPLPGNWVGSDHGTTLFLIRPRDCEDRNLPRISVFYGANVVDSDQNDGTSRPPRTDAELRRTMCTDPGEMRERFQLLRHEIVGCDVRHGTSIEVSANALYSLDRPKDRARAPDYTLTIALISTDERRAGDLGVFRKLLSGVTVCRPAWARAARGQHPCRETQGTWW